MAHSKNLLERSACKISSLFKLIDFVGELFEARKLISGSVRFVDVDISFIHHCDLIYWACSCSYFSHKNLLPN